MTSLADQTVLVTGANRGMGREYVAQLLDRGVTKVYAAARDPRTIDVADPRVVALQLDVTDATSVAEAAAVASDVSVLINNAGISRATSVLDPDTSNLREEMETNLFGPLAMASTFADRIAERSGAIVNVASVLAWMPVGASYGVSKAAMWSATDSMRLELGSRGVQVVGVYVGLVDTDMAKFTDYPKSDPADVVRQVLDGIESGADEVLADEMTRDVRAQLGKPIQERCHESLHDRSLQEQGRRPDRRHAAAGGRGQRRTRPDPRCRRQSPRCKDRGRRIQNLPAVPISTCSRQRRRRRCGRGGSTGAALQAR